MPDDHEPLELFEAIGSDTAGTVRELAPPLGIRRTQAREDFLTGMLAQWAADDRERGAKPITEEKRRAREGARAALGEILR